MLKDAGQLSLEVLIARIIDSVFHPITFKRNVRC